MGLGLGLGQGLGFRLGSGLGLGCGWVLGWVRVETRRAVPPLLAGLALVQLPDVGKGAGDAHDRGRTERRDVPGMRAAAGCLFFFND